MVLVDHRGERCEMDENDLLGPFDGGYEDDNEIMRWFDGYICCCHGEIVKKSVHLTLKKGVTMIAEVGSLA